MGTFCLLGFLFHSAWMETQLNQSPSAHWGVLACKVVLWEVATGQTGRAEVRGRIGAEYLRAQWAAICPRDREARTRRQAPMTACYRHMLLEHVRTLTGMAESGMGWYGLVCTKLNWPYLLCSVSQGRKCHWGDEPAAWSMLVLTLAHYSSD